MAEFTNGKLCICVCVCNPYILPSFVACRNTQMRKKLTHFVCVFLSSANKCLLKVGAYCAQLEQYQKAIEIYEQVLFFFIFIYLLVCLFFIKLERICLQVGANTMDNPLLKYSAKEYFFKASLCHFIVDELNAKVSFSLCCAVLGLGKHG